MEKIPAPEDDSIVWNEEELKALDRYMLGDDIKVDEGEEDDNI
jgi:hypothetical protein